MDAGGRTSCGTITTAMSQAHGAAKPTGRSGTARQHQPCDSKRAVTHGYAPGLLARWSADPRRALRRGVGAPWAHGLATTNRSGHDIHVVPRRMESSSPQADSGSCGRHAICFHSSNMKSVFAGCAAMALLLLNAGCKNDCQGFIGAQSCLDRGGSACGPCSEIGQTCAGSYHSVYTCEADGWYCSNPPPNGGIGCNSRKDLSGQQDLRVSPADLTDTD